MKIMIMFCLLSTVAFAAPQGKNKILPVTKEEEAVRQEKLAKEKLKALDKKEADCDEKAKKPIEIKPETISLGSGSTGCSLDQAH